jgi:hypothetical protein
VVAVRDSLRRQLMLKAWVAFLSSCCSTVATLFPAWLTHCVLACPSKHSLWLSVHG